MMGNAFIDRRKFLGWGALGGVFLVAGCSDGGTPEKVETPPAEGGNRKIALKKAEVAPTKGKNK